MPIKKHYAAFKAWFVCVLLGVFPEFPVDPYYEPLARFMIYMLYATLSHLRSKGNAQALHKCDIALALEC